MVDLGVLITNMFHKGKPVLNLEKRDYEDLGWKKIKEDDKSVTYRNAYLEKEVTLPKPYSRLQ